jgi:hypothetical protein
MRLTGVCVGQLMHFRLDMACIGHRNIIVRNWFPRSKSLTMEPTCSNDKVSMMQIEASGNSVIRYLS